MRFIAFAQCIVPQRGLLFVERVKVLVNLPAQASLVSGCSNHETCLEQCSWLIKYVMLNFRLVYHTPHLVYQYMNGLWVSIAMARHASTSKTRASAT